MSQMFAFGFGYCAQELGARLKAQGWSIAGTARTGEKVQQLAQSGFEAAEFSGEQSMPDVSRLLQGTTHLVHSIPPGQDGDHVLQHYEQELEGLSTLRWVGYLSTVGVYGDQDGQWVNEDTAPRPNSTRTEARVTAEQAWLEFGARNGIPVHIFRLAGIYGPGRSVFDKIANGTARRINKDGQVFSRIHLDDIATVLEASIAKPRAGAIYNVADDEPAAPGDVVAHAAEMVGVAPPPEVDFEDANLSPMARTFYQGSRKIGNALIKSELGIQLRYPTFREGLVSLKPRVPED